MNPTIAIVTLVLFATGCGDTVVPTPTTESLPPVVSIAYDLPTRVSLHAPIPLTITVANGTARSVHLALGTEGLGRSDVTVTLPDGRRVRIDPSQPSAVSGADHAYWPGDWDLAAGERSSWEIVLNGWVDFSALGTYRVDMRFSGAVQGANDAAIAVDRTPVSLAVQVRPRDPQELKKLAEDLFDEIWLRPDAQREIFALKRLQYLDDPIAVPYWNRLLESSRVDGEARSALDRLARRGKL